MKLRPYVSRAIMGGLAIIGACRLDPGQRLEEPPASMRVEEQVLRATSNRRLETFTEDPTVQLKPKLVHNTVVPGRSWHIEVDFTAQNRDVEAIGVRLQNTGGLEVYTSSTMLGRDSGTLVLDLPIPAGICGGLGVGEPDPKASGDFSWAKKKSIACHRLSPQFFAVTSSGRVSNPVSEEIGMKCSSCGEPSCNAILAECNTCLTGKFEGRAFYRGTMVPLKAQLNRTSSSAFNGSVEIQDEGSCGWTGPAQLNGTVDANVVRIGDLRSGEAAVSFDGRADLDCRFLTGSFTFSGGPCAGSMPNGTWILERCGGNSLPMGSDDSAARPEEPTIQDGRADMSGGPLRDAQVTYCSAEPTAAVDAPAPMGGAADAGTSEGPPLSMARIITVGVEWMSTDPAIFQLHTQVDGGPVRSTEPGDAVRQGERFRAFLEFTGLGSNERLEFWVENLTDMDQPFEKVFIEENGQEVRDFRSEPLRARESTPHYTWP